jgi:hypothetical protein
MNQMPHSMEHQNSDPTKAKGPRRLPGKTPAKRRVGSKSEVKLKIK